METERPVPITTTTARRASHALAPDREGGTTPMAPATPLIDAIRRREARLRPLSEFAAVRNEDGVGVRVEDRLQRPQCLHRMEPPRLLRRCAIPCSGSIRERVAHLVEPVALHGLGMAHEDIEGGKDFRERASCKTRAHRASRALDLRRLGIDLHEFAFGMQRGGRVRISA
jgi:hypothetical protein